MKKRSAATIKDAFREAGMPPETLTQLGVFRLADWPMVAVSSSEIIRGWRAWVRSLPRSLREYKKVNGRKKLCPKWLANAFDCDNHAGAFSSFMEVRHASEVARGRRPKSTQMQGPIWYYATPKLEYPASGPHAINFHIEGDHDTLRWFEPALGLHVSLLNIEIKGINYVAAK